MPLCSFHQMNSVKRMERDAGALFSTDIFNCVGNLSLFLATGRQSVESPIEIAPTTDVNLDAGFQMLAVRSLPEPSLWDREFLNIAPC
jgi:hypothetical protein